VYLCARVTASVSRFAAAGALDYFYTSNGTCVEGGPGFDFTYYNTWSMIVQSFTGIVGVLLFQVRPALSLSTARCLQWRVHMCLPWNTNAVPAFRPEAFGESPRLLPTHHLRRFFMAFPLRVLPPALANKRPSWQDPVGAPPTCHARACLCSSLV